MFFKLRLNFLEEFKLHSKTEGKVQRFPIFSPPPTHYQYPLRAAIVMHAHWHIIITPSSQFAERFDLGVLHSVGLDKCVMTCFHHYAFSLRILIMFFKLRLNFLEEFKLHSKTEGKVQRFSITPLHPHRHSQSRLVLILPTSVVHLLQLVNLVIHYNHPKSTVYIVVQSLCLLYILWVWTIVKRHVSITMVSQKVFSLP